MPEVVTPLEPGVWAVTPTPFSGADLTVDAESLRRLTGFYRDGGMTGLVALGVFGEAAQLSADEQAGVLRIVVDAAGELPVVVGLSALSTAPAVEQAQRLLDAAAGRVRAFMVQVNTPDGDALVDHLDAIAAATGVGVVMQDYPLASGVRIAPANLASAAERCSAVVAVKAESAPTAVAIAELTARLRIPVFGGLGGVGLLDELAAGAAGAMTGFSHPEGLWAAVRAHRDAGFDAARRAYAAWLPLANFEGQPGIGLAIRKEILHRRGLLASPAVRPPGAALPPSLLPLIERHLSGLGEVSGG